MSVSIEALKIDRLSVAERLELIELIWDSLPDQVQPDDVPEWHKVELAKRLADLEQNPTGGIPLREALDEIERGT